MSEQRGGQVEEVKRLLQRLEMVEADEPTSRKSPVPAQIPSGALALPTARPAGVSMGSVSLLVANAIMLTATITSLAWYLIYASALDRRSPAATSIAMPVPQSSALTTGPSRPSEQPSGLPASPTVVSAREAVPPLAASPVPAAPSTAVPPLAVSPAAAPPPPPSAAPAPLPPPSSAAAAPSVAPALAPVKRAIGLVLPSSVESRASQVVRLSIRTLPAAATQPGDAVVISKLPDSVTPSTGNKLGPGKWSLPAVGLAEIELKLADAAPGRHELNLELQTREGEILSAAKTSLLVVPQPVPAPRDGAELATKTLANDEEGQRRLLTRAREILALGHVSAARVAFEHAADAGNGEAAIALGDTFDPMRLLLLGAPLSLGDVTKAAYWYERADELGSPEAKARIIGLGQR